MATAKKKVYSKSGKPAKKRVSNVRQRISKDKNPKKDKKSIRRYSISRSKTKGQWVSTRSKKYGGKVSKSEKRKRESTERTRRTKEVLKRKEILQKNKVKILAVPGLVTADRLDILKDFQTFEKARGIKKEKLQSKIDRRGDKVEDITDKVDINRKARTKRGEKVLTKEGKRKPFDKDSIEKFDKSLKKVSNISETVFLVGDNNLGLQAKASNYDDAITIIEKLSAMPGAFLQVQVIPEDEILEKYFSDRPFSSTQFRGIPTTQKRDVMEISLENIITSYMQNGWGIKEIRINYHVT